MSDSLWPHGLVHGILQARILECIAIPFSRGPSQPRDQSQVSHITGGFCTSWATREAWEVRSNQSILKVINPDYSLEGLMLKLQYFGHLIRRADSLEKTPDAWKDWRPKEKGTTEDEVVRYQHWLHRHEFEQTLGDSEGQGSLVCCSPWGCKDSEMT